MIHVPSNYLTHLANSGPISIRILQNKDNRPEELYDHQNDPHETRNIAKSPEATAIKAKFTKYIPQEWAEELSGRRF